MNYTVRTSLTVIRRRASLSHGPLALPDGPTGARRELEEGGRRDEGTRAGEHLEIPSVTLGGPDGSQKTVGPVRQDSQRLGELARSDAGVQATSSCTLIDGPKGR